MDYPDDVDRQTLAALAQALPAPTAPASATSPNRSHNPTDQEVRPQPRGQATMPRPDRRVSVEAMHACEGTRDKPEPMGLPDRRFLVSYES